MNKRYRLLISAALKISLILGILLAVFYLGLVFSKLQAGNSAKFIQDQGINIMFGVVGGLITSALIAYLQMLSKDIRIMGKHDRFLTDTWEEKYTPDDFPESVQWQLLTFELEHRAEKISGKIFAVDSPDCPIEKRHGFRIFKFDGKKEGNLVSIDATIESDKVMGHIVYLMEISEDGTTLDGETLYYDLNHYVVTSAKVTLRRKGTNK